MTALKSKDVHNSSFGLNDTALNFFACSIFISEIFATE